MRNPFFVFILLLALVISAQCQKTAEDWLNKGNALLDQEKYDEAIKAYDEAIRLDPNHAAAWILKGGALAKQGKYDEAIKIIDEAIRLDPKVAAAWGLKGVVLHNQSKYDEAIKAIDEAIRLDPKIAAAWRVKELLSLGKPNTMRRSRPMTRPSV